MTRTPPRTGFTLVELLIVISIIVVLATLAFLFVPNLDKNKGVPNAATQLEGWIRLSKAQALKDGAPRGVRLLRIDPADPTYDPNNPNRVVSLQYIEQPDPVAPRGPNVQLNVYTQNPAYPGPLPPGTVTITQLQTAGGQNGPTPKPWENVDVGDYLQLSGSLNVIARISQIGQGNSTFVLDRAIDGTDIPPSGVNLSDGFRVIRAPRALVGEPLLQMHKDVYIDLLNCYPCPVLAPPYGNSNTAYAPWSPTPDVVNGGFFMDILFNSSGQVANAPTGQIMLCVQHRDRPVDKLLVVIYTRTGKVSASSWNDDGGNVYKFALDGKGSGL